MDNNDSVQDDAVSTGLGSDAVGDAPITVNLDDKLADIFGDVASDDPSVEEEVIEETLEVSEEDEQEPSEDVTPDIDTTDEVEETVENVEEGTSELPIVDFDEAKNFLFELDGKTYAIGDLKAAINRQQKGNEAQQEVETARTELDTRAAELDAREASIATRLTMDEDQQKLGQLSAMYRQMEAAKAKAVEANDTSQIVQINEQMGQVIAEAKRTEAQIEEAQIQRGAEAAQRLTDFGFGELNTDTQRQEAFRNYAQANIPNGLIAVVNTNPELLAMVEKARLYDKGQSALKGGKLKGQAKSVKGGAAKAPKSAPKKSTMEAKVDKMFSRI